jgi:arsenate reductase
MAEGWAKKLKPDVIEASSAGIVQHGMNPRAVAAMAEAGVDIRGQSSKTVEDLSDREFDYVITLCGHANETCPVFPGHSKRVHAGFDDPPALAKESLTEEEAMSHYRRVRDEIRDFIRSLPESLVQ